MMRLLANSKTENRFQTLDLTDGLQPRFDSNESADDVWQFFPPIELPPFDPITKKQFHKALTYFDLLTQVEAVVAKADSEIQSTWQLAAKFNREDKFLKHIAKKLQLTDLQLDFIFEIGITL
jgi:hypothetical protein